MKSYSLGRVPEGAAGPARTPSYPECGGIVPGHVGTGLGQASERGKKWAAPLCPAPPPRPGQFSGWEGAWECGQRRIHLLRALL